MLIIRPARFPDPFGATTTDADLCRTLMREYTTFLNDSAGGEHICVATMDQELAALPGPYAEPAGTILLAFDQDDPAGCIALKPLHSEKENACEMKRLWVRPAHHGKGLGRALAEAILSAARERNYKAMYLDTMPATMQAAYTLYRAMGFAPVEKYIQNPVIRDPEAMEVAYLRKEL
ncbi:MAG TPA: GNAT family N-acetyltransferase [Acidobacteriaceae bacterium]|jgi:GNAT superfamily N-acetyltransferase|nr:GNAT family N-acetyltransferase [Acidobacteriaceae bacterium]